MISFAAFNRPLHIYLVALCMCWKTLWIVSLILQSLSHYGQAWGPGAQLAPKTAQSKDKGEKYSKIAPLFDCPKGDSSEIDCSAQNASQPVHSCGPSREVPSQDGRPQELEVRTMQATEPHCQQLLRQVWIPLAEGISGTAILVEHTLGSLARLSTSQKGLAETKAVPKEPQRAWPPRPWWRQGHGQEQAQRQAFGREATAGVCGPQNGGIANASDSSVVRRRRPTSQARPQHRQPKGSCWMP